MVLDGSSHQPAAVVEPVPGTDLVGVLAVAEVLHAFEGEVQRVGQRVVGVGHLVGVVEPAHDGGVVGGGVREGLAGQHPPGAG